jgi:hypothetical protein
MSISLMEVDAKVLKNITNLTTHEEISYPMPNWDLSL